MLNVARCSDACYMTSSKWQIFHIDAEAGRIGPHVAVLAIVSGLVHVGIPRSVCVLHPYWFRELGREQICAIVLAPVHQRVDFARFLEALGRRHALGNRPVEDPSAFGLKVLSGLCNGPVEVLGIVLLDDTVDVGTKLMAGRKGKRCELDSCGVRGERSGVAWGGAWGR